MYFSISDVFFAQEEQMGVTQPPISNDSLFESLSLFKQYASY